MWKQLGAVAVWSWRAGELQRTTTAIHPVTPATKRAEPGFARVSLLDWGRSAFIHSSISLQVLQLQQLLAIPLLHCLFDTGARRCEAPRRSFSPYAIDPAKPLSHAPA